MEVAGSACLHQSALAEVLRRHLLDLMLIVRCKQDQVDVVHRIRVVKVVYLAQDAEVTAAL